MQNRFWAVLLLPLAIGEVEAARIKKELRVHQQRGASTKATWLTHRQRFCVASEATVSCEGETIIDIYSAFYSIATKLPKVKERCTALEGSADGACEANFTAKVLKECQGQVSCNLPASFHSPSCSRFFTMRIVWDCVAGVPSSGNEDTKRIPQMEEATTTVATEDAEPEIKVEDGCSLGPFAIETVTRQGKKRNICRDQSSGRFAKKVCCDSLVDESPEKGEEAALVVNKLKQEPQLNVTFNPCYRFGRFESIGRGNLFGRLTNCPAKEGCYKLAFDDGRVFNDQEHPPTDVDLKGSKLIAGDDSLMVTWLGNGILRNDHHTWGICLPNDDGLLAVDVFKRLRTLAERE